MILLPSGVRGGLIKIQCLGDQKAFKIVGTVVVEADFHIWGCPWTQTVSWGMGDDSKDTALDIDATGPWKITIAPISSAPVLATDGTGSGPGVFLYDGPKTPWAIGPADNVFTVTQSTGPASLRYLLDGPNGTTHVTSTAGATVLQVETNYQDHPWSFRFQ